MPQSQDNSGINTPPPPVPSLKVPPTPPPPLSLGPSEAAAFGLAKAVSNTLFNASLPINASLPRTSRNAGQNDGRQP